MKSFEFLIFFLVVTLTLSAFITCSNQQTPPNNRTGEISAPTPTAKTINTTQPKKNPTPYPTITPVPTPTSTPVVTPTQEIEKLVPTSTPTVTPTPGPPSSYVDEMAKLIYEDGIEANQLRLTSVSRKMWINKSMDCPVPGIYYESFVNPDYGYIYTIESDDLEWVYHADSSGHLTINCTKVNQSKDKKLNIFNAYSLEKTNEIYLYRRNQKNDFSLIAEITDQNDISTFLKYLDIFIPITKTSNCKTFFQISFSTDSGNKSFEWLCEENKNIIRGQDLDWDGMDGTAPKQLGNIIGKYLIGDPMPIVPGM